RKPNGTLIIAGFSIGKIGSPTNNAAPSTGENTLGLIDTRIKADNNPVKSAVTAPVVLKRFQYTVYKITGKFALAAIQNASETRKATFKYCAPNARIIETTDTARDAYLAASICSRSLTLPFLKICP